MKAILLDTNILMDRSFNRAPANAPSMEVLRQCQQHMLSGYITTWCLMTLMYMMDEARDNKDDRIWTKAEIMAEAADLLSFITLVDGGNAAVLGGMAMGWADWEDAIIYRIADSHPEIEAIVTNDKKFITRTKALKGVKAMQPAEILK